LIPGVNDSKKVSDKKREVIFARAKELAQQGLIEYSVKSVSAKSIDAKGIAPAIVRAIASGVEELQLDVRECVIKLDGSLKAPAQYTQETIIGGDGKEAVIGLASIMAKVTRDTYMLKQAELYPQYGFAQHKGYGTKTHIVAIKQHGFCPLHRRSYCKNLI
jgi:ribonuclease HII